MSEDTKVPVKKAATKKPGNPGVVRAKSRPKRVPLHKQSVLKATQRPGYVRRNVNVTDDRIEQFKLAGWEPVVGKGNSDVDATAHPTDRDEKSVVVNSVGGGVQSMLMEIKEEFYEEDQKAKQLRNDQVEDAYSPQKRAARDKNLYDDSNI